MWEWRAEVQDTCSVNSEICLQRPPVYKDHLSIVTTIDWSYYCTSHRDHLSTKTTITQSLEWSSYTCFTVDAFRHVWMGVGWEVVEGQIIHVCIVELAVSETSRAFNQMSDYRPRQTIQCSLAQTTGPLFLSTVGPP